jgi:hypothetical protein
MSNLQRDTLLERAMQRSRTGDALLLAIACATAAVEEGTFHWNVATAYWVMAMAMWLVVSRTLGQYSYPFTGSSRDRVVA